MLAELMEYVLAWVSFEKGDCAFDKMAFFNRKHLLTSKCCFPAKRVPQNSIVLFSEQKPKSFGVLAADFKDSHERKEFVFGKPRGKNIFCFLVLFKNLGKMWTHFPCDGRNPLSKQLQRSTQNKCQWVPHYSQILSRIRAWEDVWNQHNLQGFHSLQLSLR